MGKNYALHENDNNSHSHISLEERVKNAYPSKTGLFPHEILVLDYAWTFNTKQTIFQNFWLDSYGIENVQAVLISLLERGYLYLQDINFTLNKHTIAQLKTVLKNNGLKIPTTKKGIIQILLNSISEDELWAIFPEKYYGLTTKGKNELEENQYVIDFHRNPIHNFTPWKVNRLKHLYPNQNTNALILKELEALANKHFNDNNYGLYRNVRLDMYNISEKESKHKLAFRYLAEVLYTDLSGCGNNFSTEPLLFSVIAHHFFPYEKSLAFLPPMAVVWIQNMENCLGCDDEEMEKQLISQMKSFNLPFHLFTVEESAKISILFKNRNNEAIATIYFEAEKRFRRKYHNIDIDSDIVQW